MKRELDKRYNSDGEISRIRDVKGCVTNELILSYSKTDESLLLGDVTRHFWFWILYCLILSWVSYFILLILTYVNNDQMVKTN